MPDTQSSRIVLFGALVCALGILALMLPATSLRLAAETSNGLVVTTTEDGEWPGTLRGALISAKPGDTITFDLADTTFPATITLRYGELRVTRPITIVGPGMDQLAISGGNLVGVISATAPLHMEGLTLCDAGSEDDPLPGVWTNTALSCVRAGFDRNSGAGIVCEGGILTATLCEARENGAGGMDVLHGASAAITATDVISNGGSGLYFGESRGRVAGCEINGNRRSGVTAGGDASVLIVHSGVNLNTTDSTGGGICGLWGARIAVTDSTIARNEAYWGGGVGVEAASLVMTRCEIADNVADGVMPMGVSGYIPGSGGGVFVNPINWGMYGPVDVRLTDCMLQYNRAMASGGGVYSMVALDLDGCELRQNEARLDGGGVAIHGGGPAYLRDCILTQNFAESGGGGLAVSGGSAVTDRCLIAWNATWPGYGGGISVADGRLNLVATSVISCTAIYGDGGGIAVPRGDILGVNTTIAGNQLDEDDGTGAALYIGSDGHADLVHCTVARNAAYSDDGVAGIAIEGDLSDLSMVNCLVANNNYWPTEQYVFGPILNQVALLAADGTVAETAPLAGRGLDKHMSDRYASGGNVVVAEAKLGLLGLHRGSVPTIPLLPGSPANGVAVDIPTPVTDATSLVKHYSATDAGAWQSIPTNMFGEEVGWVSYAPSDYVVEGRLIGTVGEEPGPVTNATVSAQISLPGLWVGTTASDGQYCIRIPGSLVRPGDTITLTTTIDGSGPLELTAEVRRAD